HRDGSEPGVVNYLARNRHAYGSLGEAVARLGDRVGPDLRLSLVAQAAWFATANHPGRFADERLENIALAIGADLERLAARHSADGPRLRLARPAAGRHVLHVPTEVAGVGGPTRTIKTWAELDWDSTHTLALTSQVSAPVPDWIRTAINRSSGQVIVFPAAAPPTLRARWLRDLARDADIVLVHHFA